MRLYDFHSSVRYEWRNEPTKFEHVNLMIVETTE